MKQQDLLLLLKPRQIYSVDWKGIYGGMHEFEGEFIEFQILNKEFIFLNSDGDEENFLAKEIKKCEEIKDGEGSIKAQFGRANKRNYFKT